MDFHKVIENRRSTRSFIQEPVSPENLEALKEAALRAPTSRNNRPWRFYFVTDRALLNSLSRVKSHGSAFLKDAPLGIVVTADEEVSDVWIEDSSIATTFLLLEAENLGLGACWIQVRNRKNNEGDDSEEVVRSLLDLPGRTGITSLIAIGVPEKKSIPVERDKLLWDRIEER